MRDAVVVSAVRTPIGRRSGVLSAVHPVDLSAVVLTALTERTGLDPAVVDDVLWGCVSQAGEQTSNVARSAVLAAGWPESVPGVTIDRQCGSSQQALAFAAAGLVSGQYDVVVAGGVESMSRVPLGSSAAGADPFGPGVRSRYADALAKAGVATFDQGVGAELVAARWGLDRERLDAFAWQSHQRAATAAAGAFDEEIVAVTTPDGHVVTADQGIRRDSTLERLATLPTPFRSDGVVTAGSSSQISDGAAALLMTTSRLAARYGWEPLARVHATVLAAADPVQMLTAPIPATHRLLGRAGVSLAEVDAYEVNEAFAPVPLAWLADTGADPSRLNPRGGAIALGHPLGASGARLTTTLLHYLRQTGGRIGLQTMCEGGGQANATLFTRP